MGTTKALHSACFTTPCRQRGAAAIEFGLLFLLFFCVFYALVSYALPMLMLQAFHHAAAAGLRAAVAVERDSYGDNEEAYKAKVDSEVQRVVAALLSWLPAKAKNAVLGTDGEKVQPVYDDEDDLVHVTITYPDYHGNPLIPILNLPGFGEVPKLPNDLTAVASLQL
jgi:Flp pilus assembly protein TadG